jgi:hypothetical protein
VALPQVIPLFGLQLSGLLVAAAAGLACGAALCLVLARRGGSEPLADAGAAALPLLAGALIGARLANQLLSVDLQPADPATWFLFTGTSVSFGGALVGGAAGALLGLRRLPAARRWAALDLLAAGAALAVAVGWLGLSGPSRLPVPASDLGLAGFAGLAALLGWQWPRRDYAGQNAATFVVLASALRFALGFALQAPPLLGPWSLTQLGDAATGLAGLALTACLAARGGRLP